ncbi:MAG TPA: hypothetical protein VK456_15250 [Xanthobacteraceae bacterium]|nr:hypothetical protein [Xanthobacteraceae bacterium]
MQLFGPLPPNLKECRLLLPASLSSDGQSTSVRAQIARWREGAGEVRLSLPERTPPGEYAAQLEMNGEAQPVALRVEPSPRLRAIPAEAVLEARPGAAAEQTVTLSNEGNVAVRLPAASAVCLHDDNAWGDAFASTCRLESDDPQKLFNHFILALRKGYGGMLKLRIDQAGDIPPQMERTLTIRARLSEDLLPGHSYGGEVPLGPLLYSIAVKVLEGKRGDRT